jgi:hypothetical protein
LLWFFVESLKIILERVQLPNPFPLGHCGSALRLKSSGSILALFAEPLNFSSLTLYLGLIGVDLFLLIRLLNFLSLHLVANKSASTETKRAANRRSGPRMAHGGTDDSARRGAAKCADSRAFLARCQVPARTADP